MRVLVACEFSGVVREAFNSYHGVYALSCDLLPPEDGRVDYHYQGDVRDIINDGWDLMIAHPPCTFLTNAGVRWLYEKSGSVNEERWSNMSAAADFFRLLMNADIPRIAVENPIPHRHAMEIIGRKYDQIVQPYMFGHPESKQTCLWLKGLPPLYETNNVEEQMRALPKNKAHKVHYAPPSPTRWMDRSRTKPGLARAMADQWGARLLERVN